MPDIAKLPRCLSLRLISVGRVGLAGNGLVSSIANEATPMTNQAKYRRLGDGPELSIAG